MSQNITFKIQDIKCDHLPKPAEAWIKQAFSVKVLLGSSEYSTGPINGSTTASWSNKFSLQALGSSFLKIEVHNRINNRNKVIGSSKDTVHNFLKESSSVVRTLRRMDRRGIVRETAVELTFSIALLSQDSNAGLLVSSFEQSSEQPDTKQLERRIPEEFEERGQIDSDISPLLAVISSIEDYYMRGRDYHRRFERAGDLADLDISIASMEKALALTPDGHPNEPLLLSNVGAGYNARFERLGDLTDLENVMAYFELAVALIPDGHPSKPHLLSNLGSGYRARFERLGNLADVENSITNLEQALACTPDGHPDKPMYLSNIGVGYGTRFERAEDLADLEISIASMEQALALTPDGHPNKPDFLSNLGAGYAARFDMLGNLADVENAIANFQQAFALTPDGHPSKPNRLADLGGGYHTRFKQLGNLADLENSLARNQQALALTPDGHADKAKILSAVGRGYDARFMWLGDLSDVENSIANLEQAIALTLDGHPNKPGLLSELGGGYYARFGRLGDLADVENSIANLEQGFALTPDGHSSKSSRLTNLGTGYHARFERLGDLADLENAITNFQQAIVLAPDGHPRKATCLSNLGAGYYRRFERLGDLADVENAIANFQQAITLTPDGHPKKAIWLLNLGEAQTEYWIHTHEESHLHHALSTQQSAAQSLGGPPSDLLRAARSWATLSLRSGDIPSALEAFRTAIEILPQVAWLGLDIASRQDWLAKEKPEELGCMAATCAIRLGRFEEAVELLDMTRSVFWQQASSVRSGLHDLMAEQPALAKELETVSQKLDDSSFSGLYASNDDTQLYEHRLAYHRDLVLKRESLIDKIRSLPGFELFLKPTPFDRLRAAAAAGRVIIINISKLGADALVFDRTNPIRHVPLSKVDVAKSFKHADDIELKQTNADITPNQQSSLTVPEVWDGWDGTDILKSMSRSIHGTSWKKRDVTTTDGIAQKQARADVTEDRQRSLTLLPRVWKHILKPIFTEVGILLDRIKDQVPTNRIFWYLTGPLTSTAIHAAGSVSQLVVSSYVTTLISLAEAQTRQSNAIIGLPRLLAITQPDTPGQRHIPHCADEVDNVVQAVSAAGWSEGNLQRFDGSQATVDQVSTALNTCSWVHFACHAMQHPIDGMESAFALHDGSLKLSVIAAKQLASARFAFLSTCESATGLQDSPGEAMHLSAGMQFAGFSSVIATMWSIQDEDAPIIAKHTYAYLLRNGVDNIDLTEGAAALNHAVSQLREDSTVTTERWAPFVYYGV